MVAPRGRRRGGAAERRATPQALCGCGLFFLLLSGLSSPPLLGQDTTRAAPDSVDAYTLLIRGQEDAQTRVRTFPRTGQERLLPPLARIVLPRDSIDFINAETLGDVLGMIPGVYLWRGGWIGRPEMPNYMGRGATSVEYLIDGVPWVPLGPDSLATDPSLMPIGLIDRIEIETLPGKLRVHLMLRNHEVLAPRTRVAVARGDFDQARYEGLFEKRWRSGFGLALGAEYLITDGPNEAAGDFSNSLAWAQADWVPSTRFGLQLRYLRAGPDRSRVLTREEPIDTLVRPMIGTRGDLTARLFIRGGSAEEGLGRRFDLIYNRSAWTSDEFEQKRWQAGLTFSDRGRTHSLGASAFYGSAWTKLDARVSAGWSPVESFSAAVEGVHQEYDEDRSARWITARAGVTLPLGFQAGGVWRSGTVLDQPSVALDSVQDLSDRELSLAWTPIAAVTARAGYTRLGAWRPTGMWAYAQVDSIAPSAAAEWLVAGGRIAPRQWFTVSGWYHKALNVLPEGTPPDHSVIEAAIRSKFLRTFPSGIFDLKLAVTMESWGTGVLGRSPDGEPVTLKGATFFRALAQMQFLGFIVYFDRSNLLNTDLPFVPGLPVPRNISSFGFRWSFLN